MNSNTGKKNTEMGALHGTNYSIEETRSHSIWRIMKVHEGLGSARILKQQKLKDCTGNSVKYVHAL